MVLQPLEFSECYLDSPWFRETIQQYEEELEKTNSQIKHLIKDGKSMLSACRAQGKCMTQFNDRLQNFQFDFGGNLTDDEKSIAGSLKEFGLMLEEVASEWFRTIERSEIQLIQPLEEFRSTQIRNYRECKKSFEKASERYYKQLEQTLGLSHKKKEQQLQESDNDLIQLKKHFHEEALHYVDKLQEIQERKKFEFVEHFLMFMQIQFNYFHQNHETAMDFKDYMTDLQMRLVATRQQYNGARDKTQTLMKRMADQPDSDENIALSNADRWSRAGYLFLMDKNSISARLGFKSTRYFCMYKKDNKTFKMIPPHHSTNATLGAVSAKVNLAASSGPGSAFLETMIVKACTGRHNDTIDKRFCFDLEVEDFAAGRQFSITLQAASDVDRKRWMAVMDGKDFHSSLKKDFRVKENVYALNETGLEFVRKTVKEIERRGVHHEGIYRLVGVLSKVDYLLQQALSPATAASVDYSDTNDWEINTLTSALKSYFRNLPEPIMTFDLHRDFIDAAKCDLHEERVKRVAALINKLPEANQKILAIIAEHLEKVQEEHETNKMNVQNLGVCFGPTLMRQRQETVQSIMEIKFSNIIVEILVEERHVIFGGGPLLVDITQESPSEAPTSPRIATKTTSHVTRLPSQRLKQRPRGAVYGKSSMSNVLEEEEEPKNNRSLASNPSARFTRSRAIRENVRRSPSPLARQTIGGEGRRRSSRFSSSSEDDGYGRLIPLDLHLDIDGLNTPSDVSPSSSIFRTSITESGSKENLTPNGVPGLSTGSASELSPPKGPDDNRSVSPAPKSEALEETPPTYTPQPKKRMSVPNVKKRASSILRRKHVMSPTADGPMYVQTDLGNNNNNSSYKKETATATKMSKPKTLAVAASIRFKKNKLIASVREGLTSPNMPVKTVRKKSTTSEIRYGVRNPKVSDSSISSYEIKSPPHNNQNSDPLSPLESDSSGVLGSSSIPTEKCAHENGTSEESPLNNSTSPPATRPRACALVEPCSPNEETGPTLVRPETPEQEKELISFDSSEEEEMSSTAITLYACEGEQEKELSFKAGQTIYDVKQSNEPGWLEGTLGGRPGLIPRNYVQFKKEGL